MRAHLFVRENNVNAFTRFSIRAIEKNIDPSDMPIHEACRFQCRFYSLEIRSIDQNVNVLRVSNGSFVNPRHPCRNSISTGDRIRNTGLRQGLS